MSSSTQFGASRFIPTSLVARITIAVAVVVLLALAFNALYGQRVFRASLEQQLMANQSATVALVASSIDDSVRERFAALEAAARSFNDVELRSPNAVQRHLEDKLGLNTLFNRGTFVVGGDGIAIASAPAALNRVGVNYRDTDYVDAALREGKSSMGRPAIGKVLGAPVLVMAAPIRDAQGKPVGALMGAIDLAKPNFLDSIVSAKYGMTGNYLLVAPQYRQIVTASDKKRVMEILPPPGTNAAIDAYISGVEGSNVHRSPSGEEVLSSVKRIPSLGWYVAATLPTVEAFAPADETRIQIVAVGALLIGLAVLTAWLTVRRQLQPLKDSLKDMQQQAAANVTPVPLPVTRLDEVGNLLVAFNQMIERVGAREEALRKAEKHQRAIIDASPVPMRLNDAAGNITFVNQAFTKTFGYELADLPTLADWWSTAYPNQQYHEQTETTWDQHTKDAQQSGMPFEPFEADIRCKDGSTRTCLTGTASTSPEYAGDQIVVLYDITERMRAERSVRDSDEFTVAVLDSLAQNIAVVNEFGVIVAVNAAWKRYAAAAGADEAVVNPIGVNYLDVCRAALGGEYGDEAKQVLDGLTAVLAGEESLFVHEYPCPEPRGMAWYQLSITPLRGGARKGAAIAHKDITDAKAAEAARGALEAQLREAQKIEAIGTLAGGISHDFNNILAAILGNTDLARADAADNAPVQQSLGEIRKAAMRGRELVQQILSFSRRQTTAKKPLDLVTEAHDSVRLLRALLPGRVQVKLVADGARPTILADRTQLQQVIVNLVTNAAHAMGTKEGVIQVTVGASTLDVEQTLLQPTLVPLWNCGVREVATVAVIDNGTGMDAATQSHIFEPFFTTKPVGEGTGLGLSVVHGIVKEHGGVITLASKLGVGTTFTVYFPLAAEMAAIVDARIVTGANVAVAKALPTIAPKPASELVRLCYLDDDEALGFLVGRQLERRGFAVSVFTAQQAALDAFQAAPQDFDAFVTDYNMPGKSGLDVVAEVLARRPEMRVAIVSGYVDEELRRRATEAGVNEVIFKADMTEELCNAIERFSVMVH